MGGLRPHELTLLCAGTGTGKTALIATIAGDLVTQDVPVFVAPVETGDTDFLTRVLSSLSGQELNNGLAVPQNELDKAFAGAGYKVHNSPLFISNYDNRVDIKEMLAVLELMSERGVKIALLDNLNFFLEITGADMERAVLDEAIHELVMFVKKHPMHIILITHPRKTINGRVESEYDIKGSATAVQECSNVLLFNRPLPKDVEDKTRNWNQREIVFKKIRKRGVYVNKPFWIEYKFGGYHECS